MGDVTSFNAGYHRGLNTEYHDVAVRTLYADWLTQGHQDNPSFTSFQEGYDDGLDDYGDGVRGIRWICANCDHTNYVTTAYFQERAEACGDEEVTYNTDCEVCHREVWDVREQPRAT